MSTTIENNSANQIEEKDFDTEIELQYYEDCRYDGMPIVKQEEAELTLSVEDVKESLASLPSKYGYDSEVEEERSRGHREPDLKSPTKPEDLKISNHYPLESSRELPLRHPYAYENDMSRCTMVYLVPTPYYTPYYRPSFVETTVKRNEMLHPIAVAPEKAQQFPDMRDKVFKIDEGRSPKLSSPSEDVDSPSGSFSPERDDDLWSSGSSPTASEILELCKLEESQLQELDDEDGAQSTIEEGGHRRRRRLRCPVCNRISTTPGNLKRHVRIHTGEKPYKCVECGQNFTRLTDLKRHALVHAGMKVYQCHKCGKGFSLKGNLTYHQNNHCMVNNDYECHKCEEQFFSLERLNAHKKTSCIEKVNECSVCRKRFSQAGNLKRHMRTHTGEKPFACKYCGKGFAGTSDLKRHELIHTGEKPYTCYICNKGFRIKCNLTIHERIHTGEKPYKCNDCGMTFRTSSNMYTHIRKHQHDVTKIQYKKTLHDILP